MRRRCSRWQAMCACVWLAAMGGAAYALPIHALDSSVDTVAGIAALGPEFVAKDAWLTDPLGNGNGNGVSIEDG